MKENSLGGLGIVLIVAVVWLGFTAHNQGKTISQLRETLDYCSSSIDEANDAIDSLNSSIEDAQVYAWDDYDSMGYALENLETQDIVNNDCYDSTNQN